MTHDHLRRLLLFVAILSLPALLIKGATPGRLILFGVAGLGWYGLSRYKAHSLDRDRFMGGKLGRDL
ncbi:MAG: hypothetical protein HY923_01815 [Elusimicrobia bacterium]|nr:hypothetical protein [Elusimicrobiota bacterium]